MDSVEAWATQRGGTKMTLTTANAVAGEFYVKRGYARVGWFGYVKTLTR